jgi:glutathione S-transferase
MTASTIVFYASRPGFDLPDTSPFVMKTEVQLKMAGLAYEKVSAIPPDAPKGKLPYIVDEGEIVPDSTFIRAHIERKYDVDLDEGLDTQQRAQAWAIERLLEDHLYFSMVWFRWIDPHNFAKGPAHFADRAPEAQREQMRRDMQTRKDADLKAHGIGRHNAQEIAMLGTRSIDALSQLLGGKSYFMGDKPASVDATALGVLAAILTPFFDTPLRGALVAHPNLVSYIGRMMKRYYPDHAWAPEKHVETA